MSLNYSSVYVDLILSLTLLSLYLCLSLVLTFYLCLSLALVLSIYLSLSLTMYVYLSTALYCTYYLCLEHTGTYLDILTYTSLTTLRVKNNFLYSYLVRQLSIRINKQSTHNDHETIHVHTYKIK